MAPKEIYPYTIIFDRYSGCYSGSPWTAWDLEPNEIPREVYGDDGDCMYFWHKYLTKGHVVGFGPTPEEALKDLLSKQKEE